MSGLVTYSDDSSIPWVSIRSDFPVPQRLALIVKLLSTGVDVMPEMGNGAVGDPASRRVKLNVRAAASQLFSMVVLNSRRGTDTETGILICRQLADACTTPDRGQAAAAR